MPLFLLLILDDFNKFILIELATYYETYYF